MSRTAWVPNGPGHEHDRADAQPWPIGLRHGRTEVAQLPGPDVGVAALVAGDRPEGVRAARILLDLRELVVQGDGIALELQVLQALLDVDR